MGIFDIFFGGSKGRIKRERGLSDRHRILESINERQEEAALFGGEWYIDGAIFPTREKELEYRRYIATKMRDEIKEKNPELYAAMERINDGHPLVLDTAKGTFYSEGYKEENNQ